MKLTKLEHSGVVLEKDGQKLVFDPVEFADVLPVLDNVVGIVITHKHGDHLQPEKVSAILDRNPGACLFAPADTVSELPHAEIVRQGDKIDVGAFSLEIFGEWHAEIIPGEVPCANIGAVVDGLVMNPGDSFDFPKDILRPKILLVPAVAPWCKTIESMDYIERVRPEIAVPVHDAILSSMGTAIYDNWLGQACEKVDTRLAPLRVGEIIEF